jgi:hypothetical protein
MTSVPSLSVTRRATARLLRPRRGGRVAVAAAESPVRTGSRRPRWDPDPGDVGAGSGHAADPPAGAVRGGAPRVSTGGGELPHPTALGATRSSLVEGGASCFCVGTCIRRGHSGSRLRRRLPFTGGSECPTPTEWTLGHNRRCAFLVALEHHRRRGERLTTPLDRRGSGHAVQ